MKLKLFKYYNPYTWKGWWHFVLAVPDCVRKQHNQMIGLTPEERKSRKGCVLCYQRTHFGKAGERQTENHWYGPQYIPKKDLQHSSKLEFVIQEGRGLEQSLPPSIRRLYEEET